MDKTDWRYLLAQWGFMLDDINAFLAHASDEVMKFLDIAISQSKTIDYYKGAIDIALYYIRGQKI